MRDRPHRLPPFPPDPPAPPADAGDLPPELQLVYTADQFAAALGISRSQFDTLDKAGRVPAPVVLSERCPRWSIAEARDWLAAGSPSRQIWNATKANAAARPGRRAS